MRRVLSIVSVCASLLVSDLATAQSPSPEATPSASTTAKANDIRRDAKGASGISPAMEAIAEGRGAYVRKDYGSAARSFEKAAKEETNKALAHYLLAQTKLTLGDAAAALRALKSASENKPQAVLAAKILFLEAEIYERRANEGNAATGSSLREALVTKWEAARDAWTAYAVYLRVNTSLPDHKASAVERKLQISARQKRDRDYGAVRTRTEENAKKRAAKAKKGN